MGFSFSDPLGPNRFLATLKAGHISATNNVSHTPPRAKTPLPRMNNGSAMHCSYSNSPESKLFITGLPALPSKSRSPCFCASSRFPAIHVQHKNFPCPHVRNLLIPQLRQRMVTRFPCGSSTRPLGIRKLCFHAHHISIPKTPTPLKRSHQVEPVLRRDPKSYPPSQTKPKPIIRHPAVSSSVNPNPHAFRYVSSNDV